jgi:hypothetical protein
MEEGPWLFGGAALVMAKYDGFTNVEEYKLSVVCANKFKRKEEVPCTI